MATLFSGLCCRFARYACGPAHGMRYLGNQGLMKARNIPSAMSEPSLLSRSVATLEHIMQRGIPVKRRKPKTPMLDGCPQKRGVILKVMIKKPKKPNSANRKCVRVRLTNGLEVNAYVPGVGHNLQEHGIVMVEGARCKDLPAVKLRCVRGKYDLAKVKKKSDSF